jgi:hypothetical protein
MAASQLRCVAPRKEKKSSIVALREVVLEVQTATTSRTTETPVQTEVLQILRV